MFKLSLAYLFNLSLEVAVVNVIVPVFKLLCFMQAGASLPRDGQPLAPDSPEGSRILRIAQQEGLEQPGS